MKELMYVIKYMDLKPRLLFLIIICFVINPICYSQSQSVQTDKIDRYIKFILKEKLNTEAALAVAVIKDNNVMFEKVYGKRDVLRNLQATTDTPFYIASITKSFVSFLAKLLESEGVINLHTPINEYLGKDFTFDDNELNASKMTILDLLTHQSKIVNDALTWRTSYTGEDAENNELLLEIFKKSKASENDFHYSNNGYILTTIIIEKVTGKSWKKLLQEKVFNKLSLNKTSAEPYSDFKYDEPALGHTMNNSKTIIGSAQKQNENSHSAGGIFSSLFDMEKWLFLHMHKGMYNGKQVFQEELFEELHQPKINIDKGFFNYKRHAYDLGWYYGTYENDTLIHCFGGFPGGYRAHMSYMPEKNIGVLAFSNLYPEGIYLPEIVANYIYDILLEKESLEYKYEELWKEYSHILTLVKDERKIMDIPMEVSIEDSVTGDYYNNEFGTLSLFYEEEEPFVKFGKIGLVKTKIIKVNSFEYKMPNPDFFNRNDFLELSEIDKGLIKLNYSDNSIEFKKIENTQN